MKEKTKEWTPDASQQYVINLQEGQHLVLAAPGCGKTQILTERIRKALEQVPPPERSVLEPTE